MHDSLHSHVHHDLPGTLIPPGGLSTDFDRIILHQMAESLGNAVDAKDCSTRNHSQTVAIVSQMLAIGMGESSDMVDLIHIAGHLHDVGKIGIPDAILSKAGDLSDAEWAWMRRHPEIGAGIVGPVTVFKDKGGIADMILHHHERYDGSGYPCGLHGDNIPVGARIICVADAFSAIVQDRPYRKGIDIGHAVAEITRNSGTQFDPQVVNALQEVATKAGLYLRRFTARQDAHLFSPNGHVDAVDGEARVPLQLSGMRTSV